MEYTARQIEIINAATELMNQGGIQQLTTKSLAEKIGFSEPAIYRHFKNKTDILSSVLNYFGMGLKTASFSQCKRLTCVTKRRGYSTIKRCWDIDFINENIGLILVSQPIAANTNFFDCLFFSKI